MKKNKTLALLLLLWCCATSSWAQTSQEIRTKFRQYCDMGQYTEADEYINQIGLEYEKSGKDEPQIQIAVMFGMAKLSFLYGDYNDAKESFQQVVDFHLEYQNSEHPEYALTLYNLAEVNALLGEYSEAERLYRNALDIQQKVLGTQHYEYAQSLAGLAQLQSLLGNDKKAVSFFQKAISILQKQVTQVPVVYASALVDYGALLQKTGKNQDAEKNYKEAARSIESYVSKKSIEYVRTQTVLASLYANEKRYTEAEALFQNAKSVIVETFGKTHPLYAQIVYKLGVIYHKQNKFEQADEYYTTALGIRGEILGDQHPDYVENLNNLALLYQENRYFAEAQELYTQVAECILYHIHHIFPALTENEKEVFYNQNKHYFSNYTAFALSITGKNPYIKIGSLPQKYKVFADIYNIQLATKGILLESSLKLKQSILHSEDENLITEFKRWEKARDQLAHYNSMERSALERKGIDLDSLRKEVEELGKQLSLISEQFKIEIGEDQKAVEWKDIQNQLKNDEAAIEMMRVRYHPDTIFYVALIISKTKPDEPEVVVIPNGKELETKYLKYYKNTINMKMEDVYSYQQFWKPIADKIKSFKKVYFSPDGVYNSLSLNGLYNTATEKYLIDETNMVILTSTRELVRPQSKGKNNGEVVFLGRPQYKTDAVSSAQTENVVGTKRAILNGASFPDLPGTEKEVSLIADIIAKHSSASKVRKLTGKIASEEEIKSVKNPSILHIATHGFFIESNQKQEQERLLEKDQLENAEYLDPMLRSGIILAGAMDAIVDEKKEDGILTAAEVMNMSLENTNLVVLSACETGLGEVRNGEGVYGLQRALKVAGADVILMSLWVVDDTATQKLMTAFYDEWFKNTDKHEAFQKAQQTIREEYPHPSYWSPFVMIGE